MGCGSSSTEKVDEDNNKNEKGEDGKNDKKKMQNIKVEINEDPEQQGEKFHQNEKDEDSFDEF